MPSPLLYPTYAACVAATCRRRPTVNPVITGLATFTLAKLIVHERAGAPIRDAMRSRGGTLAELADCTRCLGTWVALGLAALDDPTVTRTLAAVAVNDFAQAAFRYLCEAANRCAA